MLAAKIEPFADAPIPRPAHIHVNVPVNVPVSVQKCVNLYVNGNEQE